MKSIHWYWENSLCRDGQRHVGTEVTSLADERVGYICTNCYDSVLPAHRGSGLWITSALSITA